jgi:hypothetical protein
MLLMRSVDLKKNILDVIVDTIDCESKVLSSTSLCIRFRWFFFVLIESNVKFDVQAPQVMRCVMCHYFDNSTSSHNSYKS